MKTENLIPASEICNSHGIEFSLIDSFQDFDLIEVIKVKENAYIKTTELPKLEQILHFHKELKINLEGIDVIINLLERVNLIQTELNLIKNRLTLYEEL
jgi:hypothetical protein